MRLISYEGVRVEDVEVAEAGPKGLGVFAARRFVRGETAVVGRAIAYPPQRTRMSVQMHWDRHVEMDAPATLLNHSCEPNLGVRENRWSAFDFIALRDIFAGEELAFDYAMTEHALVARLSCRCGSLACGGEIRPWGERDQAWRDQNAAWVAHYLRTSSPSGAGPRLERLSQR
ncbi:MAG: SET domain-containing protein [Solirubrobacterales bacterium]|nr:SET domain-containing protein [Solirubrobacterales bacterium]